MRDAKNGTYNGEKTYCPVNGWDCPYFKNGICHIDDPQVDCDDWGVFFDSWEDWLELEEAPDDSVDETNYDPYAGCDIFEDDDSLGEY